MAVGDPRTHSEPLSDRVDAPVDNSSNEVINPMFPAARTTASPGHRSSPVQTLKHLPMWPFRIVAIAGMALAFVLYGWQVFRLINEQPRLVELEWAPFMAGSVGALGVILWTYVVVENARRVFSPAKTQHPPSPGRAVTTWILPMTFSVVAALVVSSLSRRLNSPIEGTESSVPLMLAVVAILVAFPLTYPPVRYMSNVVRKIGGHGIKLGEWLLVPVTLAVVGVGMVLSLRAGGTLFGDEMDGFAPTWVVAVAALVPATVVVLLGWRSGMAVEVDVVNAFQRRSGAEIKTTRHRGPLSIVFSENGPDHAKLRRTGMIRELPGVNPVGTVISTGLAGLALFNVVAAVVLYMFWDEGRDGVLLPDQIDRAWDLVATLQQAERIVAVALLAVAMLWTVLAVINVRIASARRRNPLIAALSWPVAGAGIWIAGERLVTDGSIDQVILGFAIQATILYLPFSLLERAADAVGARRNPFRVAWIVCVMLLVHTEGLGGLSTVSPTADNARIGHVVGYLAVSGLLQLLATFAFTDAARSLSATTEHVIDKHNDLVMQRVRETGPVRRRVATVAS